MPRISLLRALMIAGALQAPASVCAFAEAELRPEQPVRVEEPTRIEESPAAAAGCVNDRDLRHLVESRTVVPPITAIRAARSAVAGDAVSARLCRNGDDFEYRVTVLTKDGRIIRVGVDGRTGRPAER